MGSTRAAFSSPSILRNLSSTPSSIGSSSSNQSALKCIPVTTSPLETSQEEEPLEIDQIEKEDSDSEEEQEEEEVIKSSSKALQQAPRPQPLPLKRSRPGEDQRLSAEWNYSIGIAQTQQVPPRRRSKTAT